MSYTKGQHIGRTVGETNNKWGDCGFTSAFYALWKFDKEAAAKAGLLGMSNAATVVTEIAKYLTQLESAGRRDLLDAIRDFTRSFGGAYASFTIEQYKINAAKVDPAAQPDKITDDFSIAMPPHCIEDYLRRIWSIKSTVLDVSKGGDDGSDGILGLCVPAGTGGYTTGYNNCVHFVYRRNGQYLSWGKRYATLAEAARDKVGPAFVGWKPGWLIKIDGRVT